MMKCESCGSEIDPIRLEILPNTKTCTGCSTEQKRVGFLVFSHKTAPDIVMVDGGDKEAVRIARRGYERAR